MGNNRQTAAVKRTHIQRQSKPGTTSAGRTAHSSGQAGHSSSGAGVQRGSLGTSSLKGRGTSCPEDIGKKVDPGTKRPPVDKVKRRAEKREQSRVIETVHPSFESLQRRAELEPDFQKWSEYYLPDLFYKESGKVHEDAFRKCQKCIDNGGRFATSMPRGTGKSAIGKAASIYAPLTGKRKFVVPIGSSIDNAQSYHDFLVNCLTANKRIEEDYPEVTTFFNALDGSAHKAKYQLFSDKTLTGIRLKPHLIVFPNVRRPDGAPYPCAEAVIAIKSIDGRIRGKDFVTQSGKTARPDLVIPDDIQDEDTAASDILSEKMESKVISVVMNLAGNDVKIACYMPCTIQRIGDVSSRFVDRQKHPDFQGDNIPLFIEWPDDFEAGGGYWAEYETIWRSDLPDEEKNAQLNAFLQTNWEAMHAGAVVSWESRIRGGELSAVQTGMNLFFENGESFFAEYQGKPLQQGATVYSLTPGLIQSRADPDRQAGTVPEWVVSKVAATDCNPSYALTSAIVGFGNDQTAAVLWYGLYTDHPLPIRQNLTQREQDAALYEALTIHGRQLAAMPCRPEWWTVDASGAVFDTVLRFAENCVRICGINCIASTGRAGNRYNPNVKSRIGAAREESVFCRDPQKGRWVAYNADYWREIAQKGWTGSPGAPGSCSLFKGLHRDFSEQICREQLAGKADIGGRMTWRWLTVPGQPHDYGDAMAMAYMLVGHQGIGSGNVLRAPPKANYYVNRPSQHRFRHIEI